MTRHARRAGRSGEGLDQFARLVTACYYEGMTTRRIDHRTHDHPNTKQARAACRAGRQGASPTPPTATLELVWRPSPDVARVVAEIPLADLEAALAGRP